MTPLDNYLRLLHPVTNALTCIGQEIPGEGKEWVDDVIDAIASDRFLSKNEKAFLLENMHEGKKELHNYNFRYAATAVGRVCSAILEKATHHSQATGSQHESYWLNDRKAPRNLPFPGWPSTSG